MAELRQCVVCTLASDAKNYALEILGLDESEVERVEFKPCFWQELRENETMWFDVHVFVKS